MRRQIIFVFIFLLMLLSREASAKHVLAFEGELDFAAGRMHVTVQSPEEKSVRFEARQVKADTYQLFMDIQRITTPLFDFSSEVLVDLHFAKDDQTHQKYITGDIRTQYALVDYKPISDFKGSFDIKNQQVYMRSFSSQQLSADGHVDFSDDLNLEMTFNLKNVHLNGFLNFWTRQKNFHSDGLVSGTIQASGKLKELVLQGDLEAHDGFIRSLAFDHIYLDAEGIYPYVHVTRSIFTNQDGMSFSLQGPIDLSKKKMFKQQIKDMTIAPLVKGSEDSAEWTIRSSREEMGNGKFELKYLLRKDDFEKDHEDKAAGILGIQRSLDF